MDLIKEKSADQKQNIYNIYLNKTAALFRAAISAGAVLGNVDDNELKALIVLPKILASIIKYWTI